MRTFVEPGQVLQVQAELEHDGSGYAATKARISREGKKVCESELMFRIMPFPNNTLKDNMLERYGQISQNFSG